MSFFRTQDKSTKPSLLNHLLVAPLYKQVKGNVQQLLVDEIKKHMDKELLESLQAARQNIEDQIKNKLGHRGFELIWLKGMYLSFDNCSKYYQSAISHEEFINQIVSDTVEKSQSSSLELLKELAHLQGIYISYDVLKIICTGHVQLEVWLAKKAIESLINSSNSNPIPGLLTSSRLSAFYSPKPSIIEEAQPEPQNRLDKAEERRPL